MRAHTFRLLPFPGPGLPHVNVAGTITRQENLLKVHYSLTGNVEDIILPARSPYTGRRGELWQSTCFECFLAIAGQPQYWELNFSPSGDWNIYHMRAYRRIDFREETAIRDLALETKTGPDRYSLLAALDLSPLIPPEHTVEIGLAAVLQDKTGRDTYWALSHPGAEADFHRRESFVLRLAGHMPPAG